MYIKIRIGILVSSMGLLGMNLYAQDNEICPSTTNTVIFFGNGMDNSKQDARDSKKALSQALDPYLIPPIEKEGICFQISYNQDELGKLDLLEGYLQAISSSTTSLWQAIFRLIATPGYVENKLETIIRSWNSVNYVISRDLGQHVSRYQQEIAQGRKVIVVAHSQGNFYANEAYNQIFGINSTNKLKIVSVSNPDSFQADDISGNKHVTLYGDIILVALGRQDANTDVSGSKCTVNSGDPQSPGVTAYSCHGFADSYLIGSFSRPRIIAQIVGAIPLPPSPPPSTVFSLDSRAGLIQLGGLGSYDTGIFVQAGDIVSISTSGFYSYGVSNFQTNANGTSLVVQPGDIQPMLPTISGGALVGSIGSSFAGNALLDDGKDLNPETGKTGSETGRAGIYGPGFIGSVFSETVPDGLSGNIFLAINDTQLEDNLGFLTVTITITR